MVASLGAGVTTEFGAAVAAAVGSGDIVAWRGDRDPAADGTTDCREGTERAAALAGATDRGASRTARAVRDGALEGRLDFTAVALEAAEGLAEDVAADAEVSSAWAVPAPASATPTPSATAPAPSHP
jgi:hypothetical protein